MEIKSYPKVNIGLYVSSKREDGYHSIISIFHKVDSIYDVINVNAVKSEVNSISVSGLEKYIADTESTVYKAALLWLQQQNCRYAVNIQVKKNIPVQTGLGTPSANAAATLLALESFAEEKMSLDKLVELGEKIGSDVSFFLYQCDAAIVSSKGEVVKPIKAKNLKFNLIFSDNQKVSTQEAYEKLDQRILIEDLPSEEWMMEMYSKDVNCWEFRNDFEIVNKKPEIELKEGEKLMLTGSGSCWFTVC